MSHENHENDDRLDNHKDNQENDDRPAIGAEERGNPVICQLVTGQALVPHLVFIIIRDHYHDNDDDDDDDYNDDNEDN